MFKYFFISVFLLGCTATMNIRVGDEAELRHCLKCLEKLGRTIVKVDTLAKDLKVLTDKDTVRVNYYNVYYR